MPLLCYYTYMNKQNLSVIIPTIYKKPQVLYKLLKLVSEEEIIDEIILISNAPCTMTLPYSDKIKVFEPQTNAYVYTSWNFGISVIKNNNFLLLNDDILFGKNFCEKVVNSEIFYDDKTGLIGLDNDYIKLFDKSSVDDIDIPEYENLNIEFKPLDRYMNTGDWASVLFGRKENYYTIPDCFNIFYGDNYLLYQNKMREKINYSVSGAIVNHIHNSSSTSPEFFEIRDKERWAWAFYTLNYINKNKY